MTTLEMEQSVPGRDFELEKRLLEKYYKEYINSYIKQMKMLDNETDFVRDDTYNGIRSQIHIIYKLKVGERGETFVLSKDGKRGYEFVIEFDKDDAGYGIYYGCKGLIKGGNQEEEIENLIKEWKKIKNETAYVLGNTFPGKDFYHRFKVTNNANNKTFWPFWISLYEEENIKEVAARAVKIISRIYKRMINGIVCKDKDYDKNKDYDKKEHAKTQTAFTKEAFEKALKGNNEKQRKYEKFLENGTKLNHFEKDDRYEMCWRAVNMSNVDLQYLLESFYKNYIITNSQTTKINWTVFQSILLTKNGKPLTDSFRGSIKTWTPEEKANPEYKNATTRPKEKENEKEKEEEEKRKKYNRKAKAMEDVKKIMGDE